MNKDRRLIEDYLPIKAISKEASREKSVRKGHISTLHLWWARRPLVACRAAVYGAFVPADQFQPKNGPPEKRKSLGLRSKEEEASNITVKMIIQRKNRLLFRDSKNYSPLRSLRLCGEQCLWLSAVVCG